MTEAAYRAAEFGIDLDSVTTIVIIEGVLINETPLRVGKPGGGLGEAYDLPIERLPSGTPYIPGSSLKGVVRSLAEKITAASKGFVCNVFCDLSECELAALAIRKLIEKGSEAIDDIDQRVKRAYSGSLPPLISEALKVLKEDRNPPFERTFNFFKDNGLPCSVCRLFGNKELASHVIIYDAMPKDGREPPVGFRTRVAIDRFRKAARSGALFTYEYIEPGFEWSF